MLLPKKVKYRKWQKGRRRNKGLAFRKIELSFGDYGVKGLERSWITARQIEAVRRAIIHHLGPKGKIWIRVFPDKPITTKGSEVPMGKGKGEVDHYVAPVKPGTILFEITGVKEEVAKEAFRLASHKLPIKTKFVKR